MLSLASAGKVCHDLRRPIAAIHGHAELLADGVLGELDEQQADSVACILRNLKLLDHLAQTFYELVEADSGELTSCPYPVVIGEVLDRVADTFGPTWREQGGELVVGSSPPEPFLLDGRRLERLLSHLVAWIVRGLPHAGRMTIEPLVCDGELHVLIGLANASLLELDDNVFVELCRELVSSLGGCLRIVHGPSATTALHVEVPLTPLPRSPIEQPVHGQVHLDS